VVHSRAPLHSDLLSDAAPLLAGCVCQPALSALVRLAVDCLTSPCEPYYPTCSSSSFLSPVLMLIDHAALGLHLCTDRWCCSRLSSAGKSVLVIRSVQISCEPPWTGRTERWVTRPPRLCPASRGKQSHSMQGRRRRRMLRLEPPARRGDWRKKRRQIRRCEPDCLKSHPESSRGLRCTLHLHSACWTPLRLSRWTPVFAAGLTPQRRTQRAARRVQPKASDEQTQPQRAACRCPELSAAVS
jgi:hypothetical protein